MGRSSVLGDYFSQGYQSVPHIIPGVLYPAVAGKLLDGSTSHSGNYGTAQSDDRKYYYTDIKGSKPIRDPRIGAHFGSQRHKFKSLQLLEQETATHGTNVYSIDGREWIRACGNQWGIVNNTHGNFLENSTASIADNTIFIEVVGYFNDANVLHWASGVNEDQFGIAINGGTRENNNLDVGVASPLSGRCVDSGSVVNVTFKSTPTLGINTLRISNTNGAYYSNFGIELIAQDTGTTARRSQINIPAQNVVSYGKRFSIGSDTLTNSVHTHYDPFNGFTDGTTTFSSVVDVDTSLGLGTATTWGAAWDKGSSNHIRPFNGGRVVKWIDSDGTIKTSVTMMPRNAQNIGTTASNEITTVNSTNSQTINFSDDAVEHSLSEVAKKFHFREFGNGAANGGTGATYADASMLAEGTDDDIAYVMDDGLTSLSGDDVRANYTKGTFRTAGINNFYYLTFIGTGFTLTTTSGGITFGGSDDYDFIVDGIVVKSYTSGVTLDEVTTVVQNLPYGTHIFKMLNVANPAVQYMHAKEFTIHQPKMPPIPEHACVIADYMLMADFVAMTAHSGSEISKGIRQISCTRDVMTPDATSFHGSPSVTIDVNSLPYMLYWKGSASSGSHTQVPFFGTRVEGNREANGTSTASNIVFIDNSSVSYTAVDSSAGSDRSDSVIQSTASDLGLHTGKIHHLDTGGSVRMGFATPIHTSHHYTPFETPFLHELIGGDRNMEQTHLICSQDGKTWDEITRDTSYLGNICVSSYTDTDTNWGSYVVLDEWRGRTTFASGAGQTLAYRNKDFAIAYDRVICLRDGVYELYLQCRLTGEADTMIYVNGLYVSSVWTQLSSTSGTINLQNQMKIKQELKRGDYVQIRGEFGHADPSYDYFQITSLSR